MSSFVDRYKQDWTELERLVQRGRKWRSGLTSVERQRLDELYRRTTIHLARVMTAGNDPALAEYLNGLTAAAHSLIYLPPRDSLLRKLRRYVSEGFPRAVARTWRQHAISAALVIGGGLIGYFAASADPVVAHALWPAEDARQPGSKPEQLLSVLRSGRKEGGGEKFIFASFLFQHNLKVSLLAMASGVLAAAPTVLLMIFNGMLLGVFVAIHHEAGIRAEMWAWILPHGITEFGAIILCGGVGLLLGRAVVRPGALSRGESLLLAGREAGRICAGTAAMLVLAAIIESYVRQSHWTTGARLV
ncbi:MAG TPA: stage II sporulation protein M, partial [Lacipirellula sp.]